MQSTPRGLRLHLAFFGRTNAGKSSVVNALTGQSVSIVSPIAGTTTDPVEKPLEFFPLGPCLIIDTAGLADETALGQERMAKTWLVLDRTDLAVLVVAGAWTQVEMDFLAACKERKIACIIAANQCDRQEPDPQLSRQNIPVIRTSATTGQGIEDLRQAIIAAAPEDAFSLPVIASDLLPPGGLAVLVVPIDKEAPKGRLILAQVQTIRDLLDGDVLSLVVKEQELTSALERLNRPPDLVITDSQAFLKVVADTPPGVPVTSFSILMARAKGDLTAFSAGAATINSLKDGDRVLIAESCTHHAIADDIGRVKIPRWLRQYTGANLRISNVSGHDFPADLAEYHLVIHCGACTTNRRAMVSRIARCHAVGVPITNYGVAIAACQGLLERVLEPFPEALAALKNRRNTRMR